MSRTAGYPLTVDGTRLFAIAPLVAMRRTDVSIVPCSFVGLDSDALKACSADRIKQYL